MKIGGTPLEQEVQKRQRLPVAESLQLVEREDEWTVERLDCSQQVSDPALGPATQHARVGGVDDLQPGAPAGDGDVRSENRGFVMRVERDPRRRDSVPAKAPATFREQGRLAESPGRPQHRHAMADRHGPLYEIRAFEVSGDPIGDGDLLAQEPRRQLFGGIAAHCPILSGGFPAVCH